MEIRVGIIGCGTISRVRHAPEYAANPDCVIRGFYDLFRPRAEELAAIYHARVYESWEEMLADPEIDAVSVCSSNDSHAMISIAALGARKHVLCEKPMALNLNDARNMLAASQQSGAKLMIGHNQRLMPAHGRAKEILEEGSLGRIIALNTCFKHSGPEHWSIDKNKNTWFFSKNAAFFGVLGDLGIHKIDLIRWLTGQEIVEVFADTSTLNKKNEAGQAIEVEDNAFCIFKMSGGIRASMHASWCNYGDEENSTVLYCEKGVMRIFCDPEHDIVVEIKDVCKIQHHLGGISTNAVQLKSGVIDQFIGELVRNEEPMVTGEDGFMALSVLTACLESSEKGGWVTPESIYERLYSIEK